MTTNADWGLLCPSRLDLFSLARLYVHRQPHNRRLRAPRPDSASPWLVGTALQCKPSSVSCSQPRFDRLNLAFFTVASRPRRRTKQGSLVSLAPLLPPALEDQALSELLLSWPFFGFAFFAFCLAPQQ